MAYLSKSLFKLALECPTKLYYQGNAEYFDRNQSNDFLQALADGGNQVGELAKFLYHDDPKSITVETLDHDEALELTKQHINQGGRRVIAEAAIGFKDFFARVDIFIYDPEEKTIDLIEVKSKSLDEDEIKKEFKKKDGEFLPKWLPYLYDIAFQAEVARLSYPGFTIRTKLLLINPNVNVDISGLHQMFKIMPGETLRNHQVRTKIEVSNDFNQEFLSNLKLLQEIDVNNIVAELKDKAINDHAHIPVEKGANLYSFMEWAAEVRSKGERVFTGISKTCKSCQFRAGANDEKRSGVHECWKMALDSKYIESQNPSDLNRSIPLSIDIWGGGGGARSLTQDVINNRRAFVKDITEEDIAPKKIEEANWLTSHQRRLAQIEVARNPSHSPVLAVDFLDQEISSWKWPLHMIDFETSAPALPFFKGMRPYETIAFQFSHHIMEKDSAGEIKIRHANQFIATGVGDSPNDDFVRALKVALMPNGILEGTVFRYHNHENTVLRKIRHNLLTRPEDSPSDKEDLIAFIDLITKATGDERAQTQDHCGANAMVDLHNIIQEGYYSGHAGGSISLKYILPAILHDAPDTAALYKKAGVYGTGFKIHSLNFAEPNGHVWLQEEKGNDPYKTLPPIFGSNFPEISEMLFRLSGEEEDEVAINQGGIAMTAYNYTQFADISSAERQQITDALLRYCELDTLAMVILVQGLMELIQKKTGNP